ncbi:MAG: HAD hydrolase-like protein [bacterium]|nr:HAD hydrolase-like protein [bacterium]
MAQIRSVLLDLDGTLIDSAPGILASCGAALRALGHEPPADMRVAVGPPLEDILRGLLAPLGDDRLDEAVLAYRADYGSNGIARNTLYPGIGDALRQMSGAGLQLYLATSKRAVFARAILEHLELTRFFAGIHGSEPGGALDHKPELIAHVLSKHRLHPASSVMVGDRQFDISGAHANGMRAYGVLWGYGSRAELEGAGADRLLPSAAELSQLTTGTI